MYKVIIVDDEYTGCELLEKYITDYCKDFEIAGIFRDGSEAIRYLENNDVELVLTDVKMPEVSGIDLAKYIYYNKPYVKVVTVSAYSEFDYAKELMKYGVLYYLLKFVDLDEFLEAMEIVRENLSAKITDIKNCRDEMQAEMFFYDLLGNNFASESEVSESYNELEPDSNFSKAECLMFSVFFGDFKNFKENKWHYTDEMLINAVINIIKLMNLDFFIASAGLHGDNLNLIAFNHGDKVEIDVRNIENEFYTSFGINMQILNIKNVRLSDIYNGDYEDITKLPLNYSFDITANDVKLPSIVRMAIEIIDKNYSMPIIRTEIADQIHVNVVYLSKIFKKHTGQTIMGYLCECRIKKAVELLSENKTISEICSEIGYNDERGFRRAFKKYTGYSVREYKKSVL